MPIIMDFLKMSARGPVKKRDILERVRHELENRGYEEKPMATGWGLTYLQRKGYVENVRRGYWAPTPMGLEKPMTEEIGMKITAEIEGLGRKDQSDVKNGA